MHFKPSKSNPPAPVILNSTKLETVSTYKYLGMEISSSLDPLLQWNRVHSLISTNTHLLKQLKSSGLHEKILVNVYKSLVLNHLRYSSTILVSCPDYAKSEMQAFQNKLLRITGISCEAANLKYSILDVSDSRQLLISSSHPHPEHIHSLSSVESDQRQARNTFDLPVHHPNS